MTDLEWLRLAAKAAGIKINEKWQAGREEIGLGDLGLWTTTSTNWNPLANDGDALRLAVALGLKIDIGRGGACMEERGVRVHGYQSRRELAAEPAIDNGASLQAATRRAITRSAAEIGKTMP